MTDPAISLVPVRAAELAVGKPLKEAIYDWYGNLLLSQGSVIESQSQLEGLIDNGFVHDPTWDLMPSVSKEAPPLKSMRGKLDGARHRSEQEPEQAQVNKEVVAAMDDVRWLVGETLYLQQIDNPNIRYTVKLIGFIKGKNVFVTAPAVDGKMEFVREGQIFVARAFSGKKAYAFAAATVKSVHTPAPYLILSYPREVRCTVVRRGARADVKIIASVSLGRPERTAAATLIDLSTGGTSGIIKQALGNKGDEGVLKFKVHAAGQDEILSLKTVLRSVAPAESGDGFKHGFEFLDVSIHEKLILSAFVHQTLAEGH